MSNARKHVPLGRKIRAHIELADPVTWISPALITICGGLASGRVTGFQWDNPEDWSRILLVALMTGPLGTGFSQSINDYFDRDLDAINDPERPIPAGLITLNEARLNWLVLGAATLSVALLLNNPLILVLSVLGLILSVIYSMPPIKLKKNYWLGPPAVGLGYVSMSWVAGHVLFAPLTWQSLVVAILHGGLASGMLFLNDIKSVEGDRQHGLMSIAVAHGMHKALIIAYLTINISQALLMVLALVWGYYWVGGLIGLSIIVPIYSQIQLYKEPSQKNYIRYLVASNPFALLIQIASAFMVGGYFG
ncbi:MAG: UbiA family prenyltransferase [Chloroflexales bacterium]|nr:UbiA family prenyltransferase [Chloroflexales bacterium]